MATSPPAIWTPKIFSDSCRRRSASSLWRPWMGQVAKWPSGQGETHRKLLSPWPSTIDMDKAISPTVTCRHDSNEILWNLPTQLWLSPPRNETSVFYRLSKTRDFTPTRSYLFLNLPSNENPLDHGQGGSHHHRFDLYIMCVFRHIYICIYIHIYIYIWQGY